MKILTSYFGKMKSIPDNYVCISISGRAPEWYTGLEYKKLAPKWSFFSVWKETGDNDYYIQHFWDEVLSLLDVKEVYQDLQRLSGGKDIVLLCYEPFGKFCHRHLVANWIFNSLGLVVKEY